jgi:hypothetical protein
MRVRGIKAYRRKGKVYRVEFPEGNEYHCYIEGEFSPTVPAKIPLEPIVCDNSVAQLFSLETGVVTINRCDIPDKLAQWMRNAISKNSSNE